VLTLSKGLDDQGEVEESKEYGIEFVEARKDAAEAFQSPKESLDFVASAVHSFVILPGVEAIAFGRNHRKEVEFHGQLTGLVVLVGLVHDEG
jgi:hypothetical protein